MTRTSLQFSITLWLTRCFCKASSTKLRDNGFVLSNQRELLRCHYEDHENALPSNNSTLPGLPHMTSRSSLLWRSLSDVTPDIGRTMRGYSKSQPWENQRMQIDSGSGSIQGMSSCKYDRVYTKLVATQHPTVKDPEWNQSTAGQFDTQHRPNVHKGCVMWPTNYCLRWVTQLSSLLPQHCKSIKHDCVVLESIKISYKRIEKSTCQK